MGSARTRCGGLRSTASAGWTSPRSTGDCHAIAPTACTPFLVVGTAGTVSTGAVDPLRALAAAVQGRGLWFHVDGAYGAPAVVAPGAPDDLRAMSEADSIAVDPHKWLYAPLEAGCALVRDPATAARRLRLHAGLLSLRQRRRGAAAELLRVRPAELPRLPRAEGVAGAAAGGPARLRGDDRRGHPPVARAVRSGGRAPGAGGRHPGTEHHDIPLRAAGHRAATTRRSTTC